MAGHPCDVQYSNVIMSQKKVSYVVYSYPGLKQARIDIDVFLEPLMEDMVKL
jgi:hypothetical protein